MIKNNNMHNNVLVESYVNNFNIIDTNPGPRICCSATNPRAVLLYDLYINKFRRDISGAEYEIIEEYKEKIISFVENLREYESKFIMDVLYYLDATLPTLVDIVIMQWCLPRSTLFRSKHMYDNTYKTNIDCYNKKLLDNIDSYLFKNFMTDSISKTCNIPIHCIDLLWYWLPMDVQFDFTFCNSASGNYIKFDINPDDDCVNIVFNMETILDMDLGNLVTNKGPIKHYIKNFIYNEDYIDAYTVSVTKKNYEQQSSNIRKKYDKNLVLISLSK